MQETELNVKRVIIDTTFNHNLWKEGYIRIQNNFSGRISCNKDITGNPYDLRNIATTRNKLFFNFLWIENGYLR